MSLSNHKPSILFIIGSIDMGGTEKQLLLLAAGLKAFGWNCAVFTLQGYGQLYSAFGRHHIPVFSGGLEKGDLHKSPWKIMRSTLCMIQAIIRFKPAVVHAYLPLVTFIGSLCARFCRVPLVVISRRALGIHQERYFVLKPFDVLANLFSHLISVNSRAVALDTIRRDRVNPRKIRLIYNGIETDVFNRAIQQRDPYRYRLGIIPQNKVIINVANLIGYKGHTDFLKAVKLVKDQHKDVVVLLVGEDRGIQESLENEARQLGIFYNIRFLGMRSDIPCLMAASDISVVCSHEEGFSNVLLESMAAGLPVVATRVGGNSEALIDGVTGWLVPPKKPEEMARKLMDLLDSPEKGSAWGQNGKERVIREFNLQHMIQSHLKLYEDGLQTFGGCRGSRLCAVSSDS